MSSKPTLSLLVLRARDIEASLHFYRALGFEFTQEQHGKGPVHYSAPAGDAILEIYPGQPGAAPDRRAAGATMIGFRVSSVDEVVAAVQAIGGTVLTPATASPWGMRAVVEDPDGRAVELNAAV